MVRPATCGDRTLPLLAAVLRKVSLPRPIRSAGTARTIWESHHCSEGVGIQGIACVRLDDNPVDAQHKCEMLVQVIFAQEYGGDTFVSSSLDFEHRTVLRGFRCAIVLADTKLCNSSTWLMMGEHQTCGVVPKYATHTMTGLCCSCHAELVHGRLVVIPRLSRNRSLLDKRGIFRPPALCFALKDAKHVLPPWDHSLPLPFQLSVHCEDFRR